MTPRILVVAPDLPHPPFTGGHLRPLSLITALAHDHEVVVVGAARPGADLGALERLCLAVERLPARPFARGPVRLVTSALRRTITPVPFINRSRSAALAEIVASAVARYRPAAVQLETMYAVHYRQAGIPTVIDLSDVVSGLCDAAATARPLRYAAARLQQRTVEREERRLLAPLEAILAINDADAQRLRALGLEPVTVPLAVRVPDKVPAEGTQASFGLLFVGSFLHQPNREAALFIEERLAPALARRGLRCHVTIAGHCTRALLPNGRRRDLEGVTLSHVADPADLAPYYSGAQAVIAPLVHGGGTKNKTLEAMGWGRCVVGTAQAFTGLPGALAGTAYEQTPLDADLMADALVRLAGDATARARMAQAGRAYVLEHHTQACVNELMGELYERLLQPRSSHARLTVTRDAPAAGLKRSSA